MEDMTCKVYARADDAGRIIAINSSAFLHDTDGWIEIDEGYGDKYRHAQGNYLPKPLIDERGAYLYRLVNGSVVERTPAEVRSDYSPITVGAGKEDFSVLEEELRAAKILLGVE